MRHATICNIMKNIWLGGTAFLFLIPSAYIILENFEIISFPRHWYEAGYYMDDGELFLYSWDWYYNGDIMLQFIAQFSGMALLWFTVFGLMYLGSKKKSIV